MFGYVNLPRRTNPEVEIPYIFISTILPGAKPEDVEQLVTVPIEDAVEGIDRVDRVTSTSSDNVSFVVVEFESSVEPKEAREEVQPDNASDPTVMDLDFENFPVWTFTVTTQEDMATLIRFSKELKDRLEEEDEVNSAAVSGIETQEFQIWIKPETINELKLDPASLASVIRGQTTSYPGGSVISGGVTHGVSLEKAVNSVEGLRQVEINVDDQIVKLGDVATVMERATPNQSKAYYADAQVSNQRSVTFSVFKRTGADLDVAAREAKTAADEVIDKYEGRFSLKTVVDFDEMIAKQFDDLFNDFFTSVGLVFLTLFLFLGVRQATIAALVIPISFLFTFGAIHAMGLSLNFLTLFSLLLAQGMIVDDVIVMISAMTDYYKTGKFTPAQSGLLVWNDFIAPTLTSNLTNVWSFLPMLITAGIIGEFIKSIPLVVTTALIGSTAISLLVTIPLMVVILKPNFPKRVVWSLRLLAIGLVLALIFNWLGENRLVSIAVMALMAFGWIAWLTGREAVTQGWSLVKNSPSTTYFKGGKPKGKNINEKIQNGFFSVKGLVGRYKRILLKILETKGNRRKAVIIVVMFSLFSYLLVPLGLVKNEFFPSADAEQIYVGLELPAGTALEITTIEALKLMEELRQIPQVDYVIAEVGSPVENTFVTSVSGGESNKVRFSLKLPPRADRDKSSIELAQEIRETYEGYQAGKIVVAEESGGPPAGEDVQITLLGDDLAILEEKADEVVAFLDGLPGAVDADKSVDPGISQIVFVPDRKKIEEAGFSMGQIGMWMRSYLSGMQVTEERFGGEDKQEIVIRIFNQVVDADQMMGLSIPDRDGEMVPLSMMGEFKLSASPVQIQREDGDRAITITASAAPGFNIPQLGQELETFANESLDLPEGYSWKTGGANEENQESVNSLIQAMGIAAILIAATMVVELASFRKSLIVMLVIPLAVSGVFILFSITGTPISLPALIGVLALFGIVVKNSILIVDKININVSVGIPFKEAVADGASSRLEPIIFSSVTNFIGLLPITISDPLWRGLGGAIISGLLFSGTIMLFFIPVVYYMWFAPSRE